MYAAVESVQSSTRPWNQYGKDGMQAKSDKTQRTGQSGETEEEAVQDATPSDHSLKVLDSARDEDANQETYNIGSKSREK